MGESADLARGVDYSEEKDKPFYDATLTSCRRSQKRDQLVFPTKKNEFDGENQKSLAGEALDIAKRVQRSRRGAIVKKGSRGIIHE